LEKEYNKFFPYPQVRKEQDTAIEFGLESLLKNDKKFVIIEAGTGVGKSAVGLTIARLVNQQLNNDEEFQEGAYFLTTQKILQGQYEKDFSSMCSIYSSKNYQCSYHKQNNCQESQQLLKTADRDSSFFKKCSVSCVYKKQKKTFLESKESVTNFPYFITESTFSGKITPRNVLVIDEAHNTEDVLSKFVEVSVSQYFCEKIIKTTWPTKITPVNFVKWIKNVYYPKVQSQVLHFENQIEKFGLASRIKDLQSLSMKYDMIKNHSDKLTKFLKDYTSENWVMEQQETERMGYKKVVYRAIDVSKFSNEYLFRMGRKVIMMSATILDAETFASSLGIEKSDYDAISISSPFPPKNRPVVQTSIGPMGYTHIDKTLPKIKKAVEAILSEHSEEKGIIHCHTYKIANYLKRNIRSNRLLIHNSQNRDEVLKKHMSSKKPTVLLSPSMTEGVDLKGDLSKFQIICKVPYPYLGDPIIKKRMNKHKGWYGLQTAKSIVQSCGRSVRSSEDKAVTYILDSDWERFFYRNKNMFPADFIKCLV
jgi:ATP-dependent DNA helicase DinG